MPYKDKTKAKEYQKAYQANYRKKLDKDKRKAANARYYAKNRDRLLRQDREWRQTNQDEVREIDRAQYKQALASGAWHRRRAKFNQFKNSIKLHYGCMNPHCQWVGVFQGCQLEFHHLGEKTFSIGCTTRAMPSLIKEINQCTILCSNCHKAVTWASLDDSCFPRCRLDAEGNVIPDSI